MIIPLPKCKRKHRLSTTVHSINQNRWRIEFRNHKSIANAIFQFHQLDSINLCGWNRMITHCGFQTTFQLQRSMAKVFGFSVKPNATFCRNNSQHITKDILATCLEGTVFYYALLYLLRPQKCSASSCRLRNENEMLTWYYYLQNFHLELNWKWQFFTDVVFRIVWNRGHRDFEMYT